MKIGAAGDECNIIIWLMQKMQMHIVDILVLGRSEADLILFIYFFLALRFWCG